MKNETVIYALQGGSKYTKDGRFVNVPEGWEFLPSGDPALTRRLKVAVSDYWVVKHMVRQKEFGIDLCVPKDLAENIAEQLKAKRETPEYQRKLEAGRKHRKKHLHGHHPTAYQDNHPLTSKRQDETVNPTVNPTVNETVNETVNAVLSVIRERPGIKMPAIVSFIGKSRASTARAIAELKTRGKIEFRGAPKTGGYYCKGV